MKWSDPRLTPLYILSTAAVAWFGFVWAGRRGDVAPEVRDRLEQSAAMIEREIHAELTRWDALAGTDADFGELPPDATFLAFTSRGIERVRGRTLLYYPAVLPPDVRADERLTLAQQAEARRDLDAAVAAYRNAATSTARTPRAIATAGLARCLCSQGKITDALAAYEDLATQVEAMVDGLPATLLAWSERRSIFASLGDSAAAERERQLVADGILARNRVMSKDAYGRFSSALLPAEVSTEMTGRADAVGEAWPRLLASTSGRTTGGHDRNAVAIVWRKRDGRSRAIAAPLDVLMLRAHQAAGRLRVEIAIEDRDRRTLWGDIPNGAESIAVSLNPIGMPVTLRLALRDPGP